MLWPFSGKKKNKDKKLDRLFSTVKDLFEDYMTMLKEYDEIGAGAQFTCLPINLSTNEIELMNARKKLEEYLLKKNITNPVLFQTFHPDSVDYPRLEEELRYDESEDEHTGDEEV